MTARDIDPEGVATVVAQARDVAATMDEEAEQIRGGLGGAAAASGSEPVSSALADFLATQARHFDEVSSRAGSCAPAAISYRGPRRR